MASVTDRQMDGQTDLSIAQAYILSLRNILHSIYAGLFCTFLACRHVAQQLHKENKWTQGELSTKTGVCSSILFTTKQETLKSFAVSPLHSEESLDHRHGPFSLLGSLFSSGMHLSIFSGFLPSHRSLKWRNKAGILTGGPKGEKTTVGVISNRIKQSLKH